jgi:hypothetical protein
MWNDGHIHMSVNNAKMEVVPLSHENSINQQAASNQTCQRDHAWEACDRPEAALRWLFPLLVVPLCLEIPLWPFEVARTAGFTVAVFSVFV